jgi:hypothetical protein
MNLLQKGFLIFLAGVFAITIMLYAFEPMTNPDIALEVRNFTANNTYFTFGHNPVNSYSMHLYYFGNTTFEIPTARYAINTTHIKIYTNGTVGYPNVTLNSNYYSSYSYQKLAGIWSVDFTFIGILILLILVGFIVMQIISSLNKK